MSERLLELEDGVELWRLDIDEIHEQDVNARVMDQSAFHRLTENIKERGALVESFPYCAADANGKVSIISGHHRVRAARAAGIRTVHALVDRSELSRSRLVSKQLAHNAIAGHDDAEMLRQLIAEINSVEDLLRSYVAPEMLPVPPEKLVLTPAASIDYDFRLMMFAFLPSQFSDFQRLTDLIGTKLDLMGVANVEQFEAFRANLMRYGKAKEIKAVGAVIHYLTDIALRETELLADLEAEEEDVWVSLASVFGTPSIPYEAARVIRQAIGVMMRQGQISETNTWQVLEYMAAEYLAGVQELVPA